MSDQPRALPPSAGGCLGCGACEDCARRAEPRRVEVTPDMVLPAGATVVIDELVDFSEDDYRRALAKLEEAGVFDYGRRRTLPG